MNFSSIIGFLGAAAVLAFAVLEAKGASAVLLNIHALMIVVGGTAAAACVCFPIGRIIRLTLVALKKLVGAAGQDYQAIIREVISLAEGMQRDPNYPRTAVNSVKNEFLREGLQLLVNGATEDQLWDIMSARMDTFKRRQAEEVNMFKTLARFPPAFGLLGTTFGMIALLNELGGADAQKKVGPAMAIGLVATLYGIAIANFVFVPIGENLSAANSEGYNARKMILEGLMMIKRKTHPILVEEKMKSFLLPAERARLAGR
ncbi:MAG: MotA/TolQ/ExbB proton channel family protein [Methylotenera sp.]|nr:MotA/TolQ/ExbB proton channel family protein [Oligoflexia bacterium]